MHIRATTTGRITIPISIRRKLGIKGGTHIHVKADENARRIILTPITREYIHSVRGMFKGSGAFEALMEEKRRERNF